MTTGKLAAWLRAESDRHEAVEKVSYLDNIAGPATEFVVTGVDGEQLKVTVEQIKPPR
jgi:hypothetical protein